MPTPCPVPQDWKLIFEDMQAGRDVLDYLTARFAGKVYVKGGHEADRETCYRAGARDVIEHIIGQINRANDVQNVRDDETE
jgi:hypothetical protein